MKKGFGKSMTMMIYYWTSIQHQPQTSITTYVDILWNLFRAWFIGDKCWFQRFFLLFCPLSSRKISKLDYNFLFSTPHNNRFEEQKNTTISWMHYVSWFHGIFAKNTVNV